jgi:hypothetical protein
MRGPGSAPATPRPPVAAYRGTFGAARPAELATLALPPGPMPSRDRLRPLKAWRYVGVYGPELMLCVGAVRIGPARQVFWAVWDRATGRLHERTALGRGVVTMSPGRVQVREPNIQLDLALDETAGIETVQPSGSSYAWTRKQLAIRAHGTIAIDGQPRPLDSPAVIDDTSAYYERHTAWQWSAGVGTTTDGRAVAWNLVAGVNDPPTGSERTIWVDGAAHEPPPARFAADLSSVDFGPQAHLEFTAEATREAHENLLLVRSAYRQPFGCFSGTLGPGSELAGGYGVMEEHDVHW